MGARLEGRTARVQPVIRVWQNSCISGEGLHQGLCDTNSSTVVLSGIMSFEVVPLLYGMSKRENASSRTLAVSGATPLRTKSLIPIAGASPKIAVVSGPCASHPAFRRMLVIWLA